MEGCLHGAVRLVSMIAGAGVGVVEIFVFLLTWGIATSTAVAAALEAAEAAAAARHATAAAADDADDDTENDETSDNDDGDHGPPVMWLVY